VKPNKVLLMQDLTNAAVETFSYDPDEIHRLFYTGATRAKREPACVRSKEL
jgi:hypothetical protein